VDIAPKFRSGILGWIPSPDPLSWKLILYLNIIYAVKLLNTLVIIIIKNKMQELNKELYKTSGFLSGKMPPSAIFAIFYHHSHARALPA